MNLMNNKFDKLFSLLNTLIRNSKQNDDINAIYKDLLKSQSIGNINVNLEFETKEDSFYSENENK